MKSSFFTRFTPYLLIFSFSSQPRKGKTIIHSRCKQNLYSILMLTLLVGICGCSTIHGTLPTQQQSSRLSTPVAVFPLQNSTGTPEMDWISIALQESLTVDLCYVPQFNTKVLMDFTPFLREHCQDMTMGCVASPAGASYWYAIATQAKLKHFFWGEYTRQGEEVMVHLRLYQGERWHLQGEVTIRAPLTELLHTSSKQLLRFLEAQGITIAPEEGERILSVKTESVSAWEQDALGYWCQQQYATTGREQRGTIAPQCESYLTKAVTADPHYAEAWSHLGHLRAIRGNLDGATDAFQNALTSKPHLISAAMGLGYCRAEKGNLKDALPYLKRGVTLNPSLSDHHGYLFQSYRTAQLWQEGVEVATMLEHFLSPKDREAELMTVVLWKALFLQELKRFADAEKAYRQVLTFKEQHLGSEHNEVAAILDNLAFLKKITGHYEEAQFLYLRALSINEKVYGPNHPQVSFLLNHLALLSHAAGKYQEAQSLYERALAIDEKVYQEDHPDIARDLNNLAELYRDQGDYEKARPLYERALTIYEKVHGPKHPTVATILNNLALLYHTTGHYGEAKPLYERALAIDQEMYGPTHPDVARDLNNLAGLAYATGHYGDAQSLYQRALTIDEEAYGPNHPDVARDLNNLAQLYRALGDYAQAQTLYEQALTTWKQVYHHNHPDVATGLNNLAELYCAQGKYEKAKPLYEQALGIGEQVHGSDHPTVATALNNLAGVYYAMAEYTTAQFLYERALSIDEKVLGSDHPQVAIRLNNLAELYFTLGHYDRARPLYERALAIAHASGKPELLWRVQFNFGYLLARQHNLTAAIFFGKQAVNSIQQLRAGISPTDQDLDRSFMKTKWHAYHFLADLLIDRGRLPEAQEIMNMQKEEEYFDFLCRDATHKDVRTTIASYTNSEQNWSEHYRQISNRVAALGQEFLELKEKMKLGLTPGETKRYAMLKNDLIVSRLAFNDYLTKLIDDLRNTRVDYYAEVKGKRLDKPRKLQQALEELGHGAVVIHYLITDNKLRIILTTTEVQLARDVAITAQELNRKIMSYRATLQNPRQSPLSQAQELYKIVITPIDEDLQQAKAKTLMLSLDGALRYLPIAALHDGQHYVVERYMLVVYTAAAELDIKDKPAGGWRAGGFGLSRGIRNFPPLPNVPNELKSIIRKDANDPDGVVPGVIYLNDAFSLQAMETTLLDKYPMLHIASHFELNPGTKENSYLVLGDGTILPLATIRDNDYDFRGVELITLSACNTAVGATGGNGSEVESFGTLAQDQGAKGVLATLWPVADQSTGILMQHFYQWYVQQHGISKAEALRNAQLSFIQGTTMDTLNQENTRGMKVSTFDEKGEAQTPFTADSSKMYTHPFYWAPFILIGNWR